MSKVPKIRSWLYFCNILKKGVTTAFVIYWMQNMLLVFDIFDIFSFFAEISKNTVKISESRESVTGGITEKANFRKVISI